MLSKVLNWLDGKWGWVTAVLLLLFILLRPAPAPVVVAPAKATASGSAHVTGGRQVVYIPVMTPGGVVTVTIYQDCPDLSVDLKDEVEVPVAAVVCPQPPRVMLGANLLLPYTAIADLSIRLGPIHLGGAAGWGKDVGFYRGIRLAYSF